MSFEQFVGQELEWVQPRAMRRAFHLIADGENVASLQFESGSRATGECAGGKWTFQRTGFLAPKITVREAGSDLDLAVFTPMWMGGGTVAFAAAQRYQFRPDNFWRTEWVFETEDGKVLTTISGRPHLFKMGGVATVAQSAALLPETPVLLLLTWYVRVLMNADAEAAATMAAVS
jgi:hypothetical protein